MCGRYSLYTERENAQLRAILAEIARRYPEKSSQAASGEVFPSNWAPVLAHTGRRVAAGLARWGFSSPKGGGLVINARAGTAQRRSSRLSRKRGRSAAVSAR
ncbi:SOS response-associated peptidase, partial [Bittarella massiliensis]|nr:SOS response-associated peptidase [Bittarella massiliensis (ex Durand et al. 2017)]